MARFRTYKNGIFGHRYKDLYIVRDIKDGKKNYSVIDSSQNAISGPFSSYWDCEWDIDKRTASPELQSILKSLYDEDFASLSKMYALLLSKQSSGEISREESEFFEWVKKVRSRRADSKSF